MHNSAELDLFCFRDGNRYGFEFNYQDAPRLTRSMQTALEVLQLESLAVVYPGKTRYPLAARAEAVPLSNLIAGAAPGISAP